MASPVMTTSSWSSFFPPGMSVKTCSSRKTFVIVRTVACVVMQLSVRACLPSRQRRKSRTRVLSGADEVSSKSTLNLSPVSSCVASTLCITHLNGILGLDVFGVHDRLAVAAFCALKDVLLRRDCCLKRRRRIKPETRKQKCATEIDRNDPHKGMLIEYRRAVGILLPAEEPRNILSCQPVGLTAVLVLRKVQYSTACGCNGVHRGGGAVGSTWENKPATACHPHRPHFDPLHVVGQMCTCPPDFVDLGGILVHRQLAPQVCALLVPKAATSKSIDQARRKSQLPRKERGHTKKLTRHPFTPHPERYRKKLGGNKKNG